MLRPRHALLALSLSGIALAQDVDSDTTPIVFTVSSGADLWFEVRARMEAADAPTPDDLLAQAVERARALDAMFNTPLAWGLIDAYVMSGDRETGSLASIFDTPMRIPAYLRAEGTNRKKIATQALELARTLDALAPKWSEEVWPARRAALEESRARLAEALDSSTLAAAGDQIDSWLDLPRPKGVPTPVVLVTGMQSPGGMTLALRGERFLCVVASGGCTTPQLAEATLHEMLHLFERQPLYPPPVFVSVSNQLDAARTKPARAQQVVHTLYYLCAGELVRRLVDPEHRDHGEVSGYYESVSDVVAVEQPLWRAFSRGEIIRPDFVAGIVQAFRPKDEDSPAEDG